MENTKAISILNYLEANAGKLYEKPENASIEMQAVLNIIRINAKKSVKEFVKIAKEIGKECDLKSDNIPSKWLNGGNTKVRDYLWKQLKHPQYMNSAISISLFAEIVDNEARFRISIELDDANSKKGDFEKFHQVLSKNIDEATDTLVYIHGGNHINASMEEIPLSTNEVKMGLESKKYKKIQLSRIFTREELNKYGSDNEIIEAMIKAVKALLPYYELTFNDVDLGEIDKSIDKNKINKIEGIGVGSKMNGENEYPKNLILYGPPGTGKTYYTVIYAVAIIENKDLNVIKNEAILNYSVVMERYKKYKKEGRVAFTTFHQSYGYEEFIEGIKPQLSLDEDEDSNNLDYKIEPGVFKKFCEKANQIKVQTDKFGINSNPNIWKVSLKSGGQNEIKDDCFVNNRIRIGWAEQDRVLTDESSFKTTKQKRTLLYFQDEMKVGDIVLSLYDSENIDGIGVISGDPIWLEDGGHYPRSRDVKWIATGIKENIVGMNYGTTLTQLTVYKLKSIDREAVKGLIVKYSHNSDIVIQENTGNYVFIIDEINRGNISKIFGELITLIESTKRLGEPEAITATLPYSNVEFGVPNNVYILGTMNTADRSIALMDTALRRRFDFVEMMPETDVLQGIMVGSINVATMLESINERILYLYDREHTIGHAYFVCLKKEPTLSKLSSIFRNSLIPLLQEYFYEDYSKIQLILGDNAKEDQYKFIRDESLKIKTVFKGTTDMDLPDKKYFIQENAFNLEQSYTQIYE